MNTKIHLHLHVSDLIRSREFYRRFFGAEPVKEKAGYVKFLPEFAPLNLALSQSTGSTPQGHAAYHLGIQVDSTAVVRGHLARVRAAGLAVREEMGVECCHANQDKFWVNDPDGVEWEVYHLNFDIEQAHFAPREGADAAKAPERSPCCAVVDPADH